MQLACTFLNSPKVMKNNKRTASSFGNSFWLTNIRSELKVLVRAGHPPFSPLGDVHISLLRSKFKHANIITSTVFKDEIKAPMNQSLKSSSVCLSISVVLLQNEYHFK